MPPGSARLDSQPVDSQLNAERMADRKVSPSNGFLKQSSALEFIASAINAASAWPVITITGSAGNQHHKCGGSLIGSSKPATNAMRTMSDRLVACIFIITWAR